jgi:diacylglycerol kinase
LNNNKQNNFSIQARLKSFTYAWNGLKILLKEEHNARIHLVAAIIVLIASYLLKLNTIEWVIILFAIGLVFITEIINSAIENIADFVSPDKHDKIKKIKDLAAAAVLVSAFIAIVIGLIIFVTKLLNL